MGFGSGYKVNAKAKLRALSILSYRESIPDLARTRTIGRQKRKGRKEVTNRNEK
jgi:hypothetical protein